MALQRGTSISIATVELCERNTPYESGNTSVCRQSIKCDSRRDLQIIKYPTREQHQVTCITHLFNHHRTSSTTSLQHHTCVGIPGSPDMQNKVAESIITDPGEHNALITPPRRQLLNMHPNRLEPPAPPEWKWSDKRQLCYRWETDVDAERKCTWADEAKSRAIYFVPGRVCLPRNLKPRAKSSPVN
ncbi:hypothetical protein P154DRAFT_63141 [Amniculicola lignicola CBS 123094]|uniref:Uncharacterized protein n=1 Tax=Amniculicola lignicola CBS 123094 TaxID=1392246 RepID=A0A6A5WUN7_9PLEO|nr:hypothetical protein P154DRAFT_63141 [Amniculicola lignicola CBS 123094]